MLPVAALQSVLLVLVVVVLLVQPALLELLLRLILLGLILLGLQRVPLLLLIAILKVFDLIQLVVGFLWVKGLVCFGCCVI